MLHHATGKTPMRADYRYNATGVGVPAGLVDAVLKGWAGIAADGTAEGTLRAAPDDGRINSAANIARIAVQAVLEALTAEPV